MPVEHTRPRQSIVVDGRYACFASGWIIHKRSQSAVGSGCSGQLIPLTTLLLVLWATTFIEYWKIVERKIAVQWGTYGAFRVEKLRHDYINDCSSPLQKDLKRAGRMVVSIPVILGFVATLAGILTTLFAIETFITRLYTGPFHQHVVSGVSDNTPGITTYYLCGFQGLSAGWHISDTPHGSSGRQPRRGSC